MSAVSETAHVSARRSVNAGQPGVRMLVLIKRLWNVFFPLHHPYCQICGRRKEAYVTDEALRNRVTGGALSMLCFRHFDAMARSRGIEHVWRVSADPEGPAELREL